MTMPLPGFEITDVDSADHQFVFRLSQARKTLYFASEDKFTIEKWKYAINQASKGYDLSKDDVQRLGRPESPSSSEEIPEDDEVEVEDQYETELETTLELSMEKYIDDDDDDDSADPLPDPEDLSIPDEEDPENNSENESVLSNEEAT